MARFKLLLLDTCVILELFRLGLWEAILKQCDIHISSVIQDETLGYEDGSGEWQTINLAGYADRLTIHDVPASRLARLRTSLTTSYLERMDAGEAELLCLLEDDASESYLICSADGVVFRYLGARFKKDQGLSLEEVLEGLGLKRDLDSQFRRTFRMRYSEQGLAEGLRGQAFR